MPSLITKALAPMAALALGCTTHDIDPMEYQPKLLPYRPSTYFVDGRSMRPTIDDTVAVEESAAGEAGPLTPGASGASPLPTDADLINRGQRVFNITCAACHGLLGDGRSVAARKMSLRKPPSLLDPSIRSRSDRNLFAVVSDGYGLMPPLSDRLSEKERWAAIAYLRALELSQAVSLRALPARDQQQFLAGGTP